MKIVRNFTSTNATGNGYVIDESDIALINPTINNPSKHCIRILPPGVSNVWVVGGNVSKGLPDNCAIHRRDPNGSEDISHVHFVGVKSFNSRKEESFDCTVGSDHYFIDCEGETMSIGHLANNIILWNCKLKQLKVKASKMVILIGGQIDNLIFEKQQNNVGEGQGPESVFNFGCLIGSKNFNQYADAYSELDDNVYHLPQPPDEILSDLKQYSPTYAAYLSDPNPPTDPEEPTPDPTDPKYTEMLQTITNIESLLNQAFEELNVIKTILNEYL